MLTQSEDGSAYHLPLTTSTTLDTITQPALISTRSVSYLGPHNDETRNQDKLTCPTTDSKSIEEFVDMGFYQNFGRNNESKEVNEHADNEFMNLSQDAQDASMHQQLFRKRKPRKFVLEANKDDTYWERRRKNNEAAKRSRGRRRANNMSLESRVIKLTKVNNFLTAQLRSMYMRLQRRILLRSKSNSHGSYISNLNNVANIPEQSRGFQGTTFNHSHQHRQPLTPDDLIKTETSTSLETKDEPTSEERRSPYHSEFSWDEPTSEERRSSYHSEFSSSLFPHSNHFNPDINGSQIEVSRHREDKYIPFNYGQSDPFNVSQTPYHHTEKAKPSVSTANASELFQRVEETKKDTFVPTTNRKLYQSCNQFYGIQKNSIYINRILSSLRPVSPASLKSSSMHRIYPLDIPDSSLNLSNETSTRVQWSQWREEAENDEQMVEEMELDIQLQQVPNLKNQNMIQVTNTTKSMDTF